MEPEEPQEEIKLEDGGEGRSRGDGNDNDRSNGNDKDMDDGEDKDRGDGDDKDRGDGDAKPKAPRAVQKDNFFNDSPKEDSFSSSFEKKLNNDYVVEDERQNER